MSLLHAYVNGNYKVELYSDGTKIRTTFNETDSFDSGFPENIDLKITNFCNEGCKFCHENSTTSGKHADILNLPFIDTLREGTELALGGGDPLSHPDLFKFLVRLKERGIVANLTIHRKSFMNKLQYLHGLTEKKLIHGIGVSIDSPLPYYLSEFKKFDNLVIHTINGVTPFNVFETLFSHNLKVLILGYKTWGRGKNYFSKIVEMRMKETYERIHEILEGFSYVSFDNLAIEQLKVRRLFTTDQWNEFYMGDDGKFTMYIDAVEKKYALNSFAEERLDILDSIDTMFNRIKEL